ncbi:sensor histidine kinase [Vallitalea okinawensis]|uniref:sensor histidine kinase n=1 Tax=Vallitalea okinawensis TaxID=2078660 RepID=UPI000CFDD2E1|nr:sensor histidine kinase [Vallitalea okinawensis]
MFLYAVDFLANLVGLLLIYFFLLNFYEHRFENRIYIGSIIALQIFLLTVASYIFNQGDIYRYLFISISIFLLVGIFKGDLLKMSVPIVLWVIAIGIVDFAVKVLLIYSFHIPFESFYQHNNSALMQLFVSRVLLAFIMRDCYYYKVSPRNLKRIYIYEGAISAVVMIIIVLVLPNLNTNLSIELVLIGIVAAIVGFSLLVIKLIERIVDYSIREAEYDVQGQYIKSMHDFVQQLRAQRHDFNHHIGCIYGLMDTEKYQEAKKYIEQLLINTEELNALVNTNNPYVTAILNHKLSLVREMGINLEVDVDIPLKLQIKPVYLSILLGNAIDNAIEACEKVEGYRYISIQIYEKLSYLIINIKNSKVESYHKQIKTTKGDKENHGFGLKNINHVVKKYNGKMDIIEGSEEFTLNIFLNNIAGDTA